MSIHDREPSVLSFSKLAAPLAPPIHRAVFVDRDGVICRNRDDHVKSWQEFAFLPGALDALARLNRSDLYIIVITNQAIINRHMVPVEVVEDIHARMVEAVESAGGRIDHVMYCPHRADESCTCRKPEPGLLLTAAKALRIDLSRSYLIGDAEADMRAGRAVGCQRYLVLTGRGRRQLMRCWIHGERGFTIEPDLEAAVSSILRCENGGSRRLPRRSGHL
jgi:D-glycero-D-manno-heptose 1,7-bisphosphate phosphatase